MRQDSAPTDHSPQGWHRADIRAAVEKKGTNLKELAEKHGLHPAACQRAVVARNTPGERAIAELLDAPLWELWPDRWQRPATPGAEPERIDHRRKAAPS